MQAAVSPARPARAGHRHELRTLTYVILDEANGGILRNLTHDGIAVQAVAALDRGQRVRVRFELAHPRLRLDTLGEVVWAKPGGQCGIRFVDLPPRTARRMDEWIFGNLLEGAPLRSHPAASMFPTLATTPLAADAAEDDGLLVSPAPLKIIELPTRPAPLEPDGINEDDEAGREAPVDLDWLSQPLSGSGIAWLVNGLAVLAALLLFVLVFLSVAGEAPRWPVAMAAGTVIFVVAAYWGFFKLFGGVSLGTRLARLTGYDSEEEQEPGSSRFR